MREFPIAKAICLLSLCSFLALGAFSIRYASQTCDEGLLLVSGYSYFATGDFRMNQDHPPLGKLLLALPVYLFERPAFSPDPTAWETARTRPVAGWVIAKEFLYGPEMDADRIVGLGRLTALAAGFLTILLIGLWSYRLWGWNGAAPSVALASFDPTLLAHSSLATLDVLLTFFFFLTAFSLFEYERTRKKKFLLAACAGGAAILEVKFVGLALLLLLGAVWAFWGILKKDEKPWSARLMRSLPIPLLVLGFSLLAIPCAYFFQGYSPWISGFLLQSSHAGEGHTAYFLGEYSSGGWWTYFLAAFFLKTPVGTILALALSLLLPVQGARLSRQAALWLLAPAAAVFLLFSWIGINIGVRYVLPAYPFLFALAGRIGALETARFGKILLRAGPPLLATASVLAAFPHFLGYFNEPAGGWKNGHRFLADSNLDWGQDVKALGRYLKENGRPPLVGAHLFTNADLGYYGIEVAPPEGGGEASSGPDLLAVSVQELLGVSSGRAYSLEAFLNRTPEAFIGTSIRVYDLSRDAGAYADLARWYQAFAIPKGPRYLDRAQKTARRGLTRFPGDPRLMALSRQDSSAAPEAAKIP